MKKLIVVYDVDDTLVTCNEVIIKAAEELHGIDLGPPGDFTTFKYQARYPEAKFISTGKKLAGHDWDALIDIVTRELSLGDYKLKPGVLSHFEELQPSIRPIFVTARPANHLEVTKQLIEKHFGRFIDDIQAQLILPDTLPKINGEKPHKAQVAISVGAVAMVDDALHNLDEAMGTSVIPILYRDTDTTWNHKWSEEGIIVAEGWPIVTKQIKAIIKRQTI